MPFIAGVAVNDSGDVETLGEISVNDAPPSVDTCQTKLAFAAPAAKLTDDPGVVATFVGWVVTLTL